jgi:hypothetical protein
MDFVELRVAVVERHREIALNATPAPPHFGHLELDAAGQVDLGAVFVAGGADDRLAG